MYLSPRNDEISVFIANSLVLQWNDYHLFTNWYPNYLMKFHFNNLRNYTLNTLFNHFIFLFLQYFNKNRVSFVSYRFKWIILSELTAKILMEYSLVQKITTSRHHETIQFVSSDICLFAWNVIWLRAFVWASEIWRYWSWLQVKLFSFMFHSNCRQFINEFVNYNNQNLFRESAHRLWTT